MNTFSEESLLLARNWDTVEDIFRADERLRKELSSLLLSIKSELVKNDWWQDGWVFVQYEDTQVYISNKGWEVSGVHAVWIGVEGFTPESIFGTEPAPTLYVWVTGRRYDLAQMLAKHIEKSDYEVLGEIDHRTRGYVVRSRVSRCLPEEAEEYDQVARKQIIDFLAHYARLLWSLKDVVRDYLAALEDDAAT